MPNGLEWHYLYRILLPDGRGYIGVAKRPKSRFSNHCRADSLIGKAIRHHGRHACSLEILCASSRDYIYALEPLAIVSFNTRWPLGYNLAAGGIFAEPHPETIAKTRRPTHAPPLRLGEFCASVDHFS